MCAHWGKIVRGLRSRPPPRVWRYLATVPRLSIMVPWISVAASPATRARALRGRGNRGRRAVSVGRDGLRLRARLRAPNVASLGVAAAR